MKAQTLLSELRGLGVELAVEGLQLSVDAPAGAITGDLRAALVDNKRRLIKLLVRERRKLEAADKRGLVIRRSREPGYIALHDPLTGEWHEVKASECLPSIIAAASKGRRRTGRTDRKNGGAA
jgi:hypothetical protein